MGLTENQKRLIEAISKNDMTSARKCAIACLSEDKTAKNSYFTKRYKDIISNTPTFMELPQDMKGFLVMEDVSSFRNDRYYLTKAEEKEVDRIVKMNNVSEKLSSFGITYTNATMFYGKSGTGKTMLGRYIAYKLGLPFCYVNFSTIISSYMGNTSKNIGKIFDFVSKTPCVLMLDELDCIGTKRGAGGDKGVDGEINRIVISIIQEINRLPNNIILLAATNRPDMIDEAIIRRFKLHVVNALTKEESFKLLCMYNDTTENYFTEKELKDLIDGSDYENQSYLIRKFIEMLAEKILNN